MADRQVLASGLLVFASALVHRSMSTTAIILAAGKSTRMRSNRPKVLHEVCGRSMLWWVLRACYEAGCDRVIVVVGHGKERVMAEFAGDDRIVWVEQAEQLGTGHAARMAEPHLREMRGDVFILVGDAPLIRGQVLSTLRQVHQQERAAASMATAVLDDPTGYGRIVRDARGEFVEIVEQLDCTEEQLNIREVFPSYYCCRSEELLWALGRLTNDNKKGEYYLTDIFGLLRKAGKKVTAVQAVTAEDVIGVNNRHHLAEVDAILQERIQRGHRDTGVTINAPVNTYIEANVSIGSDTIIQPFTYIGRDSQIGANCCVGPFACVPRESIVPEGASVTGDAIGGRQ
jgi:bifunctional UDP-N-acetylglucosamine pyrophosphorylase/glucosamine-1-phosphate N-acetyltransferase